MKTFLNTWDEWHALVIGFFEVLCPWPPRWGAMSEELGKALQTEHHYYRTGRALGFICLLFVIGGFIKWMF
jgi:hypothetical protein